MNARDSIEERARRLLSEIPPGVTVVAAAKMRTPDEVRAVLAAGVSIVGENYVQEAASAQAAVSRAVARWHLIGRLQRNKAKDAVRLFDLIQTVDSVRLAEAVDAASRALGRIMPVLVEINSGRDSQKAGALPEDAADLVRALERFEAVRVVGLMTMGPLVADPEALRPAFRETKRLFDELGRNGLRHAQMQILSMGMSDSYRVAIEEGATMVRVGMALFGPRMP